MFCQNCGKEVNDKAAVCLGCGVAVNKKGSPQTTIGKGNHQPCGLLTLILSLASILFASLALSLPITQLAVHLTNSFAYLSIYSEGIVLAWVFSGLAVVCSTASIVIVFLRAQTEKFHAFLSVTLALSSVIFALFLSFSF